MIRNIFISLIIFISFIPIPWELFGISLETFIFISSSFLVVYPRFRKPTLNAQTIIYVFCIYFILYNMWAMVLDRELFLITRLLKMIIIILLIGNITSYKSLVQITTIFTLILFSSAIFGLLLFYYGEPFAGFRMRLYHNYPEVIYYGKGDRIVGFSKSIFNFAYTIAVLPPLLLMLHQVTKYKIYIIAIVISYLAIILNGERAAFLFATLAIAYLLIKGWQNKLNIIIVTICGIAIYYYVTSTDILSFEHNVIDRFKESETADNEWRVLKQIASLQNIMQNPFTGGTEEEYKNIMERWSGYRPPTSAHNSYLRVAENVGVIGFVLLYFFFSRVYNLGIITRKCFKILNLHKEKIFFNGIGAALIASLLVGAFHNDGIFIGERTSIILVSIYLAFSRVMQVETRELLDKQTGIIKK